MCLSKEVNIVGPNPRGVYLPDPCLSGTSRDGSPEQFAASSLSTLVRQELHDAPLCRAGRVMAPLVWPTTGWHHSIGRRAVFFEIFLSQIRIPSNLKPTDSDPPFGETR